jgi:hypothetical protein
MDGASILGASEKGRAASPGLRAGQHGADGAACWWRVALVLVWRCCLAATCMAMVEGDEWRSRIRFMSYLLRLASATRAAQTSTGRSTARLLELRASRCCMGLGDQSKGRDRTLKRLEWTMTLASFRCDGCYARVHHEATTQLAMVIATLSVRIAVCGATAPFAART